jgi:hypothetical protein
MYTVDVVFIRVADPKRLLTRRKGTISYVDELFHFLQSIRVQPDEIVILTVSRS